MGGSPAASSDGNETAALTALAAASAQLDDLSEAVGALVEAFVAAGFRFYVVGGWVRDLLRVEAAARAEGVAAQASLSDIDVTTNARPEQSLELLECWASVTWTTGIAFGTVAGQRGSHTVEITTHRGEQYRDDTRKPVVSYSDDIATDLGRRDFTVNAMAIELPSRELIDPFGGLEDLRAGVLRAPGDAVELFSEDPLRVLRAARFVATLGLVPDEAVVEAMRATRGRLEIVAAERLNVELTKLLGATGSAGVGAAVELLARTGVLAQLGIAAGVLSAELGGEPETAEKLGAAVAAVELAEPATTASETETGLAEARWAVLVSLCGHGVESARALLGDLRYSTKVRQQVTAILNSLAYLTELTAPINPTTLDPTTHNPAHPDPDPTSAQAGQPDPTQAAAELKRSVQVAARRWLARHAGVLAETTAATAALASVGASVATTNPDHQPQAVPDKSHLAQSQLAQSHLLEVARELAHSEGAPRLGAPLDGNAVRQVAEKVGHPLEGAQVGAALEFLLDQHCLRGPLNAEQAEALLAQALTTNQL